MSVHSPNNDGDDDNDDDDNEKEYQFPATLQPGPSRATNLMTSTLDSPNSRNSYHEVPLNTPTGSTPRSPKRLPSPYVAVLCFRPVHTESMAMELAMAKENGPSSTTLEESSHTELGFDSVTLLLFGPNNECHLFQMPLFEVPRLDRIEVTQKKYYMRPNDVQIESELSKDRYDLLLRFCRKNLMTQYNFPMEYYIESPRLQSFLGLFVGCWNITAANLQQRPRPALTPVYRPINGLTDAGITPEESLQEHFHPPLHTILVNMGVLLTKALDPPNVVRIITPESGSSRKSASDIKLKDDEEEEEEEDDTLHSDTSDDSATSHSVLVPDGYGPEIVSTLQFTSSYPTHLFTFIAYLGVFITKTEFINNCAIGYKTVTDLYEAVRKNRDEYFNRGKG